MTRHLRRAPTVVVLAFVLALAAPPAGGQDSIDDAREQRAAIREERARAAAELDAARAADEEVAAALAAIDANLAAQQLALDDATRQLAVAQTVAEQARLDADAARVAAEEIRGRLGLVAVNGFLGTEQDVTSNFLQSDDPNGAMRQTTLLQLANSSATDLIEEMRSILEDRDIAEAIAADAVVEAARLEAEMAALVVEIEAQRAVQAELKAELEARVGSWEAQLAEFEADEERLSEFIRAEQAKLVPVAAAPNAPRAAPGSVSSSGFQWPINAPATSEYGWRIHPIFGTKRLHSGIDLGAGTGTPIYAAAAGTVITAGAQNGYGNTVIIGHGNGQSTLYAHQSKIAVANGDVVQRGDLIGYVGSTGNSTGPHLHFEIRIDGTAVNPRGYLP